MHFDLGNTLRNLPSNSGCMCCKCCCGLMIGGGNGKMSGTRPTGIQGRYIKKRVSEIKKQQDNDNSFVLPCAVEW